ncbi:MAG: LPP20 family lipoprotein [Nitrospirae bacterium]|nr:LPP20 family lipoprotein [Nitrospirota bacterium]
MNMIKRGIYLGFVIILVGMFGMAGCAKKLPSVTKAPAWVTQGSAAFNDSGNRVFYGVGSVTGVKNKPLARTAAENRARAEIGKVFETYTASLMRDYMASTAGGAVVAKDTATSEEQHIEQTVKTFSAVTLSGVMIADHWTDPADGTVYALARLDLSAFRNSLDKARELNSDVRDFVKKNAENAFDKLEAEEKK